MKKCYVSYQGYPQCNCLVRVYDSFKPPCSVGLKVEKGEIFRLVYDVVLSRPEDYLSIYQSCCNHNCLKRHSWYFTQIARGEWFSPEKVVEEALNYRDKVTVWKSRSRATMWHASDLCAHCGSCIVTGSRGPYCPGKLKPEQVLYSPQGWGPARNIASFTGGDLYCQPAYYIKTFKLLKKHAPDLWIHIETNGYGLTPKNLELLYEAGLDSIWLDLKAYNRDTYQYLCGTVNDWILEVPIKIEELGLDLVLEVVILYIPTLVEHDQIVEFAELLVEVDEYIPVTILAFFPEYNLKNIPPPTREDIIKSYKTMVNKGLKNVRIGNVGVICKTKKCIDEVINELGREALGL